MVRNATLRRIELADVDSQRFSVLIVRDGEQDSPEIAAVVRAVHSSSARLRRPLG